jgi:hypothetical protein
VSSEHISRGIYFIAAIRGDQALSDTVIDLVGFIRRLGIPVLNERIDASDVLGTTNKQTGTLRALVSPAEIEQQAIECLDKATHVIAEISASSTSVGRAVEYARTKGHFGKVPAQVLCLYRQDREFFASPMIRGMTHDRYPNFTVRAYSNPQEARTAIMEFLISSGV